MKSKSLFIAALVVCSVAVAAIGKEEPRKAGLAVIPVKGTEVFKVIYKGDNTNKVKLNIYNSTGSIIFTETINSEGFIRPLNFSGLASGEYTVELVDANGKKVEKISFYPAASTIKSIRVAKMTNEQSKFMVAVANVGSEVINVKIYDGSNTLLHNETSEISGNFAQVYSIKTPSSGYTFEITDKAGNVKTVKY